MSSFFKKRSKKRYLRRNCGSAAVPVWPTPDTDGDPLRHDVPPTPTQQQQTLRMSTSEGNGNDFNSQVLSKPTQAEASVTTNAASQAELSQPPPQQQPEDFSPIVRACQMGELSKVQDLIAQGEATAQDAGDDSITLLHWAAINNRLSVCKYLIQSGAQVDVKGGELEATPLHWASRSGLVYIVHLLIQHGADPLRTDAQGFNALHLATHSSNVLLVIYLLHQGLPVDTVDPHGRAASHWAAYQGDALSIDCLLNWGANVKLTDSLGFTPLHWSIVKGNRTCMKRLIEEGSDVFAKTNDGKNPRIMAEEMHTVPAWQAALEEAGRLPTGAPRIKYMTKKQVDLVMFFVPFVLIALIVTTLMSFMWWWSIPLVLAEFLVTMTVCKRFVLPNAYSGHGMAMKSPFLAGIFAGSCFWTVVRYVWVVLPSTILEAPLLNLVFTLVFGTVLYAFFRCMLMDPGYVPKLSGITEQKQVIEELIDRGEYDSKHFCIITYIRKPLRSRYDKSSQRVVAKFDHYCPWTNNVIGVRNHRMFLIYIVAVMIGLPLMDYLYFGYYTNTLPQAECVNAPDFLCQALTHDSFTTQFVLWDSLQLSWVFVLVFVQLVQIGRSITTVEASNIHKFGSMAADNFSSLPSDHHASAVPTAPGESVAFAAANRRKWYSSLLKVLGIDQFISTAQDLGNQTRRRVTNPADYGVVRNCTDFWCPQGLGWNLLKTYEGGEGSLNGEVVDYYSLYEFPVQTQQRGSGSRHAYEMVEQQV